jgi:transcriptional regulator with XRE-family HTH domain
MTLEFNEFLRKRREEIGLTQKELAEKTGISRYSIINYENGRRSRPSFPIITKLAEALEVSTGDLWEGSTSYSGKLTDKDGNEYPGEVVEFPEGHPMHIEPLEKKERREMLFSQYELLNNDGQKEAVKRVGELTEISRYQKAEDD